MLAGVQRPDVSVPSAPANGLDPERRFFERPPLAVWAVALFAALLHMLPWLHAAQVTPEGWQFTGNVTVSPDAMQYRVWMRQALEQGPVVDDRFTTEPSGRFLPVAYYWMVGRLGQLTGLGPEWANAWLGAPLAALLAVLCFLTARYFLGRGALTWVVFLGVLFGGGLTAHLKLLRRVPALAELPVVGSLVDAAYLRDAPTFEDSRFHYLIRTLFDSHFVLIWLWTLAGLVGFFFALKRPAPWKPVAVALAFVGLTLLHIYEGVTVLAVMGCVTLLCWRKGLAVRPAVTTFVLSSVLVGATLAGLFLLQKSSGLPFPTWAAPSFPVANILLAFPLGWALAAAGSFVLWRDASLEACFLLGWTAACTAMLLSHPYYPYHDRGAVTLQVGLHVLAGAAFLSLGGRADLKAIALAVVVFAAAPVYVTKRWWDVTRFDAGAPWLFLSPEDQRAVELLSERGRPEELLLADDRDYRWLCPDFRGRSYDAHFFLTVDFEAKRERTRAFFEDPVAEAALLEELGVDYLFVNQRHEPARFAALGGLTPLFEGDRGTLFSVEHGG